MKTIAKDIAEIFVDHCVIPHGMPKRLLANNWAKFVRKLLNAACVALETKLMTTCAYHPQTNAQTERYNKTIVSRLRHYIGEFQVD